jgi:hypothetical protein
MLFFRLQVNQKQQQRQMCCGHSAQSVVLTANMVIDIHLPRALHAPLQRYIMYAVLYAWWEGCRGPDNLAMLHCWQLMPCHSDWVARVRERQEMGKEREVLLGWVLDPRCWEWKCMEVTLLASGHETGTSLMSPHSLAAPIRRQD